MSLTLRPRAFLTSLLAGLTLGLSACAQASGPVTTSAADGVSAAERAAFEAIVRELLVKDPSIVRDALAAIEADELLAVRAEIENVATAFSVGPADAKVTIVELFDYRCGYCKTSMEWLFAQRAQKPDDIRLVFKEYPILSEASLMAARAALAAGRQGKYIEMHQGLMRSRGNFTDAEIDAIARTAGVDVAKMRADMEGPEVMAEIARVGGVAEQFGVRGTPAFFVNGVLVPGFDRTQLETLIAEGLGG